MISDHTGAQSHRGDGEGASSATSGIVATAEGNGPVNALDGALRRPSASLPGPGAHPPGRLPGPGARHGQGHRRGHPGAHRLDRRRADLDHHRRVGEHHRGVVAGPVRLHRLRSAARRRRRAEPASATRAEHLAGRHRPRPTYQEHTDDPTEFRTRSSRPTRSARPTGCDVPGIWTQSRPSELRGTRPAGPSLGTPGPDQGFALKLARRFEDRLELAEGESTEDAIAGCGRGGHAPGRSVRSGAVDPRPELRLHPVGVPG